MKNRELDKELNFGLSKIYHNLENKLSISNYFEYPDFYYVGEFFNETGEKDQHLELLTTFLYKKL